ncbi:MAG: hypothetical protein EDM69_05940 [Chlorobiota bacterium]|nr:MAG: hypothetical protein EDM69_05940 [Chlorobiota bacterium]MCC6885285.1 hypothetical protein [Ignavibacteriales bacterium]MCE7953312.1 hypothetical protein [Chlorobi bacterium CHB7]OQY78208.1 MAG: hypothetical protein B6D43_03600 [Ignavibacteriales bacterium UTCHB1]RIK48426.1 MAG: hypothetical protein DCC60_07470 [Ignavibacteriota bacterium]
MSSRGNSQVELWETFSDMKTINSIEIVSDRNLIYCASEGGLFSLNLNTGEVLKKYTNITGLATLSAKSIKVDNHGRLWVGSGDGSISILDLSSDNWTYIFDIKNSTEQDKAIYDMELYEDFIFVATGYGIQKISTSDFSFVDAPYYKFGYLTERSKVTDIKISNDVIHVATSTGYAKANLIGTNLNNPSTWEAYNGSPLNIDVQAVEVYNGNVMVGSKTGLLYNNGSFWLIYPNSTVMNANIKDIHVVGQDLYFISNTEIYKTNSSDFSVITQVIPSGAYTRIETLPDNTPVFGTTDKGVLVRINNNYVDIAPNGPNRNSFDNLSIDSDGILWAAGGDANGGFYKFDGLTWTNYTTQTHPEIGNGNFFRRIIAGNGIVWALNFGGGATKITGDQIINYNPGNSNLPGISGNPDFCVPFGGAFDNNGRFWLTVYVSNVNMSLWTYNGDNTFTGFTNPSSISSSNLENVAIDEFNTKWIVSGEATPQGLYFFNENGTVNNPTDDISGFYNNSDFPGGGVTNINDVIVDGNNEVWVATNNGIFIINNPRAAIVNPAQKPAPVKLRLISGNLAVPFTEVCNTLTKDVLNQKWVGTVNNGVFHISSDGATLLDQYNVDNSPILSNEITSIAVNPKDGVAYFGTLKGLSALKTSAIEPLSEFDEIVCSPNPLILPSAVDLRIDGLIENTKLMIMTLDGRIIDEFDSPGGKIATWTNSRNLNLASGVYIVVAFNKDGSKVGKGKFAVIKK